MSFSLGNPRLHAVFVISLLCFRFSSKARIKVEWLIWSSLEIDEKG